ncbi:hypothetical protein ACFL4S_01835, partial [bacterium]
MSTLTKKLLMYLGLGVLCVNIVLGAELNYKGKLEEGGEPVTGTKVMKFNIYNADIDGTLMWTSGDQSVDAVDGAFTYVLGSNNPIDETLFASDLYLELIIDSVVLCPRERLLVVPYAKLTDFAMEAGRAGKVKWEGIEDKPLIPGLGDKIGSYHIIDGTIQAVDIADGAIIDSKVSSVSWTKLIDVPAGFADGIDDTGIEGILTENVIFSTHIANGQIQDVDISVTANISVNKLSSLVMVEGENISLLYNDAGYLTSFTEIDPTVLASVKDGVDWTEVTSIPSGFADGIDDTAALSADVIYSTHIVDGQVKDADINTMDWSKLTSIPSDLADGDDDTQLTESEVDTYVSN